MSRGHYLVEGAIEDAPRPRVGTGRKIVPNGPEGEVVGSNR